MKNFWSGSLLLLLFTGCVSIRPADLQRGCGIPGGAAAELPHRPGILTGSRMYRASMEIRNHTLSGILLVKRMDSSASSSPADTTVNLRTVFMNEVGMTFFDLELTRSGHTVISAFPSLNKKSLFRILDTDLRVLFGWYHDPTPCCYRQAGTGNRVIRYAPANLRVWESWKYGDTLVSIAARSNPADAALVRFIQTGNKKPGRIEIQNPVIGLKLTLTPM